MLDPTRRRFLAGGLAAAVGSAAGCLTDDEPGTDDGSSLSGDDGVVPDALADLQPWLPAETVSFATAFYASPANPDYEGGGQAVEGYVPDSEASQLRDEFGVEPDGVASATGVRLRDVDGEGYVVLGSFDPNGVLERVAELSDDVSSDDAEAEGEFQVVRGVDGGYAASEAAVVVRAPDLDALLDAYRGERERLLQPDTGVADLLDPVELRGGVRWRDVANDDGLVESARERYDELGVRQRVETGAAGSSRRHALLFEDDPSEEQLSGARSRVESLFGVDEVADTEVSGRIVVLETRRDTSPEPPQVQLDVSQHEGEPRPGLVTIEFRHRAGDVISPRDATLTVTPTPDEGGLNYDDELTSALQVGDQFSVSYELGETVDTGDRIRVVWSHDESDRESVITEYVVT